MFIGSEETGWRSAVIYTFVEQIRVHGKDPFAYFGWVFEKLMHNPALEALTGLLPVACLKRQREAAQTDDTAAAWEPEMRDLSQKCERGYIDRLPSP